MNKKWKIGDKCWCNCCCGPEFEILDITHGFAIINHLPPVAVRIEELYPSEEEFEEKELNKLFEKEKEIKERIIEKRELLKKFQGEEK